MFTVDNEVPFVRTTHFPMQVQQENKPLKKIKGNKPI